jgi:hypothetical protein
MCRKRHEVMVTFNLVDFSKYGLLELELEKIGLFKSVIKSKYTKSLFDEVEFISSSKELNQNSKENYKLSSTTFAGCFAGIDNVFDRYMYLSDQILDIFKNENIKEYMLFIFIYDRTDNVFKKYYLCN